MNFCVVLVLAFGLLVPSPGHCASYAKAVLFNDHGLTSDAKRELIEVICSDTTSASEKSQSYYLLGSIDFDEKNVAVALKTWKQLITFYPSSASAAIVKDRITSLSEIVGQTSKESLKNAVATSYLDHADFWSKDKDDIFNIDASWIPNVEAASKWYDKTISEFPNSDASRLAYEGKIRTLLGWKEPGQDGDSYGVKSNFDKYMPQVLETFAAFEKENPDASTLQAFRYQIAQAYWNHRDWDKTREWLNLVITKAGQSEGFYKDLAERRLQKVEY